MSLATGHRYQWTTLLGLSEVENPFVYGIQESIASYCLCMTFVLTKKQFFFSVLGHIKTVC